MAEYGYLADGTDEKVMWADEEDVPDKSAGEGEEADKNNEDVGLIEADEEEGTEDKLE